MGYPYGTVDGGRSRIGAIQDRDRGSSRTVPRSTTSPTIFSPIRTTGHSIDKVYLSSLKPSSHRQRDRQQGPAAEERWCRSRSQKKT